MADKTRGRGLAHTPQPPPPRGAILILSHSETSQLNQCRLWMRDPHNCNCWWLMQASRCPWLALACARLHPGYSLYHCNTALCTTAVSAQRGLILFLDFLQTSAHPLSEERVPQGSSVNLHKRTLSSSRALFQAIQFNLGAFTLITSTLDVSLRD